MGFHLGRFIYLLDAALDYDSDRRKGKYNPFVSMGAGKNWQRWEEYLVLAMGRCTDCFERLPLVQDKEILDNILYRGKYNPFVSMGAGKNWQRWEEYLVLAMGRCTDCFERLPLVQDKEILDNILYSGVWMNYRRRRKEEDQPNDR